MNSLNLIKTHVFTISEQTLVMNEYIRLRAQNKIF